MRMSRVRGKRVTVVGVVMVMAALLLLAGCGGKTASSIGMVPDSANVLADVQIGEVLQDPDGEAALSAAPGGDGQDDSLNEMLDEFQAESGIDARELSRLLVFGDAAHEEFVGLIAKGSFDEEVVVQKVRESSDTGVTSEDYKGHTLHVFGGDFGKGPAAMVVLDADTAIFGAEDAVRQAIDVVEGDRERVSGEVLDKFNSLGDVWFKLAMQVPADAQEQASELPTDLPIDMSLLTDVQVVGVAVDKEGEDIRVVAEMDFATEESARDAGDALDGAVKLFRSFMADEKVRGVLDSVEVVAEGNRVTVTLEVPVSELQELMEGAGELGGGLR